MRIDEGGPAYDPASREKLGKINGCVSSMCGPSLATSQADCRKGKPRS